MFEQCLLNYSIVKSSNPEPQSCIISQWRLSVFFFLLVFFSPAVLAAGSPERAAFMSDEGVGSVPGLTPIQYTAKHYDLYLSKMIERTKKLNKGEGHVRRTAWDVSLRPMQSVLCLVCSSSEYFHALNPHE